MKCKDPQDEIFVSIETVPIDKLRIEYEYEALSYHWGDGEAEHPIYVRDNNAVIHSLDEAVLLGTQRLYVKPNLYKALRHLRSIHEDVTLWVDAICINQEDQEEKRIQVRKMAQIYNTAARVCVWLGPGDKQSDNAMKFINDIIDVNKLESELISDERYTHQWNDLVDLMKSSWFSRRWVIQELALARDATVHCGNQEVHWNDFKDAVSLFVMHFDKIRELFLLSKQFSRNQNAIGELDPLGAKVLVDITSNIFRKSVDGGIFEPSIGLERLVSTLYAFESSDPRDTIYALLNIAQENAWVSPLRLGASHNNPPPQADYRKDLLEVYTAYVKWAISESHSIDIICRYWAIPEKEERAEHYPPLVDLPSWVKSVSDSAFGRQAEGFNGRMNGDSLVGHPGRNCYSASHSMLPEVRFGADGPQIPDVPTVFATTTIMSEVSTSIAPTTSTLKVPGMTEPEPEPESTLPILPTPSHLNPPPQRYDPSLYVEGRIIDTITWTSSPTIEGIIEKTCLQKGGWRLAKEDEVVHVPDKLWRTLVADRAPDGSNPPGWYHRACLYCLVNETPNGNINTVELLRRDQPDIIKKYLKRVQSMTWNRKFIETSSKARGQEKLFGLAPPHTNTGDLICVLFGCSVPCILRRQENEEIGVYYEFIGESYIYGKMDGDAVTSLTLEELAKQTSEFRLM